MWTIEGDDIIKITGDYYWELFTLDNLAKLDKALDEIEAKVTDEMNVLLIRLTAWRRLEWPFFRCTL